MYVCLYVRGRKQFKKIKIDEKREMAKILSCYFKLFSVRL